jgi:hypothetical protein
LITSIRSFDPLKAIAAMTHVPVQAAHIGVERGQPHLDVTGVFLDVGQIGFDAGEQGSNTLWLRDQNVVQV